MSGLDLACQHGHAATREGRLGRQGRRLTLQPLGSCSTPPTMSGRWPELIRATAALLERFSAVRSALARAESLVFKMEH